MHDLLCAQVGYSSREAKRRTGSIDDETKQRERERRCNEFQLGALRSKFSCDTMADGLMPALIDSILQRASSWLMQALIGPDSRPRW